jgi:spore coat polysaccharide biosynthesis protein SpsF
MKIGLQITARMKSSRLPFKLLMDLNGYSIIEHVINRSKLIKGVEGVVLCTSINAQDKPLVDVARENDIYYFLGSEADVLQRLLDSASFFGFDYILSITGENPLFSIDHTNRLVDIIKREKPDFTFFEGLPIGCGVYGIKVKALELVCKIKKEIDTEIWGPLINRPEIFKVTTEKVNDFYHHPNLRLTNDYFEDYMLMSKMFSHFSYQSTPSLYHALELLENHPDYLKINAEKIQAGVSNEVLDKIDQFYKKNLTDILKLKQEIYHDI